MRKALIIDQEDIDTFSDIRHAIVSMGAVVALYRKQRIMAQDAMDRIVKDVEKADGALNKFFTSGL
jgi:hypothetical protein